MSTNYYNKELFSKAFLTNGGSRLLNVDGSVTPIPFTYAPGSGFIYRIHKFEAIFTTTGNVNQANKFLDIAQLTAGVQLELTLNTVTFQSINMVDNWDLGSELGATFQLKLIGQYTLVSGMIETPVPIVLDGNNGDVVTVNIRDDLSALEECAISVSGTLETL